MLALYHSVSCLEKNIATALYKYRPYRWYRLNKVIRRWNVDRVNIYGQWLYGSCVVTAVGSVLRWKIHWTQNYSIFWLCMILIIAEEYQRNIHTFCSKHALFPPYSDYLSIQSLFQLITRFTWYSYHFVQSISSINLCLQVLFWCEVLTT